MRSPIFASASVPSFLEPLPVLAACAVLLLAACGGHDRRGRLFPDAGGDAGGATDGGTADGGGLDGGARDGGAVDAGVDGGVRDGGARDGGMDAGFDAGTDAAVGPCPAGLVAWYRFESTTGAVLDDCGGHDGYTEGTGFTRGVAGRVGLGIRFDGTDGRVVVPHSSDFDFVTAGTIEMWVSIDSSGVGSTVSRGTGMSDDNVLQNTSCWNMQTIFSRAAGGTTNVTSSCDTLPVSSFAHVAVVNDGSDLRMYVDGVLETSATGGYLGPIANDLYIGRREQGIFPFDGIIDEIKWWDVARTPAQICRDAGGTVSGSSCVL